MTLLSSLDHDFIERSLGRKPGKAELKILTKVLYPVLVQRELIPPRFVNQIGQSHKIIKLDIRQINEKGKWASPSYLVRDCVFRGLWPIQLSYIWLFNPIKICMKKVHNTEEKMYANMIPSITHHFSMNNSNEKSGQVIVIAIMDKDQFSKKVGPDQLIGYIPIPKPGKTLMNEKRIMSVLGKSNQFVSGFSLEGNSGDDLYKLFSIIPESASIELTFPDQYKRGDGLIISEGISTIELHKIFNVFGYKYKRIGKIKADEQHILNFGGGYDIKWPKSVIRLSVHGNDPETKKEEKNNLAKRKPSRKKPNVLNVVKKMIERGFAKIELKNVYEIELEKIIKVIGNKIDQSSNGSYFNGIRSVGDIVRKLAMAGSNIESLELVSNIDDKNFLAGQQSAIHSFGIRQISTNHFNDELIPGHFHVIGSGNVPSRFPSNILESDFVSLLGTLKGELQNSLYQKITGINFDKNEPNFDSTMEFNINQALVQAVSTNVVKRVHTISKGGLSMTLIKLYQNLGCNFGIKIHISRRLTSEELLFGESFGSALVVVGEKELMEFQRICMVHGIPCSTIGRLQLNNEIYINQILKIKENTLKIFSQ